MIICLGTLIRRLYFCGIKSVNVPYSIFIASYNNRRIFRRFTHPSWKKNQYFFYEEDSKVQSFLYIVEEGTIEVFKIKQDEKGRAIINDEQCGSVFGKGHNIYIRNDCDKIQRCNKLDKIYASELRDGSVKPNKNLSVSEDYLTETIKLESDIVTFRLVEYCYNNLFNNSDMKRDSYLNRSQESNGSVEPQPYRNLKEESQGPLDHLDDGLEGQARAAFIAKAYALLSLELIITFSFCLVAQYSEQYRNFQFDNDWAIITACILYCVTMFVAYYVKKAKTFPLDMIILLVFIVSMSYIISFACSAVVDSTQDNTLVPITIAATIGISLALTIYAFVCKGNYLLWIGILLVCFMTTLTLGIAYLCMQMTMLYVLLCSLGLIIYGIYLVIITKMIISNELGGFLLDSPIIASVFLYIYIMRIFLYLLSLFSKK